MYVWRRNLNYIKAVVIQSPSCSQRTLSSPEHCFKLARYQGRPHTNKVKQYDTVLSFNKFVCSVDLVMKTKRVYLGMLGIEKRKKKLVNENLCLLNKTSSPILHSATVK